MFILVIGNFHIPSRATSVPEKFRKLLVPGKISQIITTGNLCDRETWEFLKSVSANIVAVDGEFDDELATSALSQVLQYGRFNIGIVSGILPHPCDSRDALAIAARRINADVMIFNDSRHRCQYFEQAGKFFLSPGSATGVKPLDNISSKIAQSPSFMLFEVQGAVLILYIYRLVDGQVKVEKVQYRKKDD